MTPSVDVSGFTAALKAIFIEKEVQRLTWEENPFLSVLPKNENFGGEYAVVPVQYGLPQGRSARFSTAQANAYGASRDRFKINATDLADDFGVATWSDKVVEASRADPFAFVEADRGEIDGILQNLGQTVEWSLLGNGSGKIAKITSSGFATTTITVEYASDLEKVEPGMKLVVAADESSAPRDSGKTVTVSSVNVDSKQITATANWNTISGIAQNDLIFIEGDYTAASDRKKIKGLEGWIPATAPTAGDSWYGVDRSVHVTRLAGNRLDASGYPMLSEALKEGQLISSKRGRPADLCLISYNKYDELLDDLMGKVEYSMIPAQSSKGPVADIAFRAAMINGPKGRCAVMPHRNLDDTVAWMLRLDSWELWSMRGVPHIMDKDGQMFRAMSNDPGYEVRAVYYAQLVCKRPLNNVRIKLA